MVKRIFDIIFSCVAIIILSPLILPLVLLLKLTGESEIFFIQQRVGKDGRVFGLIKFATMLKDSPNLPGGDITSVNDPRVLPMGLILRKTKINELPQLWNILKGDMSVVGPRPFSLRTFCYYSAEIQKEIITLKPGLTGIGSIVFRDEEAVLERSNKPQLDCYCEDLLPYKGKLEVWYKQKCNIWVDIKLIFLTIWVVLFPCSVIYDMLLKGLPERPFNLYFDANKIKKQDRCTVNYNNK